MFAAIRHFLQIKGTLADSSSNNAPDFPDQNLRAWRRRHGLVITCTNISTTRLFVSMSRRAFVRLGLVPSTSLCEVTDSSSIDHRCYGTPDPIY